MKVLVITFEDRRDENGALPSTVIWLEDISEDKVNAKIGFILEILQEYGLKFSWSIQDIENNA